MSYTCEHDSWSRAIRTSRTAYAPRSARTPCAHVRSWTCSRTGASLPCGLWVGRSAGYVPRLRCARGGEHSRERSSVPNYVHGRRESGRVCTRQRGEREERGERRAAAGQGRGADPELARVIPRFRRQHSSHLPSRGTRNASWTYKSIMSAAHGPENVPKTLSMSGTARARRGYV